MRVSDSALIWLLMQLASSRGEAVLAACESVRGAGAAQSGGLREADAVVKWKGSGLVLRLGGGCRCIKPRLKVRHSLSLVEKAQLSEEQNTHFSSLSQNMMRLSAQDLPLQKMRPPTM